MESKRCFVPHTRVHQSSIHFPYAPYSDDSRGQERRPESGRLRYRMDKDTNVVLIFVDIHFLLAFRLIKDLVPARFLIIHPGRAATAKSSIKGKHMIEEKKGYNPFSSPCVLSRIRSDFPRNQEMGVECTVHLLRELFFDTVGRSVIQ